MGLPITAGCDTAWIQTRVSVVTPQALRFSALDRCAPQEPRPYASFFCKRDANAENNPMPTVKYGGGSLIL